MWGLYCLQITREAEEKTGKYISSLLKQLEQQLGLHAFIFVAYKDTQDEVKISEYVLSEDSPAKSDDFKVLNPRE